MVWYSFDAFWDSFRWFVLILISKLHSGNYSKSGIFRILIKLRNNGRNCNLIEIRHMKFLIFIKEIIFDILAAENSGKMFTSSRVGERPNFGWFLIGLLRCHQFRAFLPPFTFAFLFGLLSLPLTEKKFQALAERFKLSTTLFLQGFQDLKAFSVKAKHFKI